MIIDLYLYNNFRKIVSYFLIVLYRVTLVVNLLSMILKLEKNAHLTFVFRSNHTTNLSIRHSHVQIRSSTIDVYSLNQALSYPD